MKTRKEKVREGREEIDQNHRPEIAVGKRGSEEVKECNRITWIDE